MAYSSANSVAHYQTQLDQKNALIEDLTRNKPSYVIDAQGEKWTEEMARLTKERDDLNLLIQKATNIFEVDQGFCTTIL